MVLGLSIFRILTKTSNRLTQRPSWGSPTNIWRTTARKKLPELNNSTWWLSHSRTYSKSTTRRESIAIQCKMTTLIRSRCSRNLINIISRYWNSMRRDSSRLNASLLKRINIWTPTTSQQIQRLCMTKSGWDLRESKRWEVPNRMMLVVPLSQVWCRVSLAKLSRMIPAYILKIAQISNKYSLLAKEKTWCL